MNLTLPALTILAILTIAAVALLACATPRERSQPEPSTERQVTPASEAQQQSELADLIEDAQADASAVTAADSFRMSGSGDAEAAHVLQTGQYQCGVTLKDNREGGRRAPFRIQFLSRDPIAAPLVTWSEPFWNTNVDFVLFGREGSASAAVEVKLRAAPLGQWTLECDRQPAVISTGSATTTVTFTAAVSAEGSLIPSISTSSGSGTTFGTLSLYADYEYNCSISVERNVDESGVAARFLVKIGREQAADVTAAEWSGQYQYFREAGQAEAAVSTSSTSGELSENLVVVSVTAGRHGDWSIVCAPKLS